MNRIFSVVTPAIDRNLLTIAELRDAAGLAVGDTSQDAKLTTLGLRVSDMISRQCNVEWDGVNTPTLLLESVKDEIRYLNNRDKILLSRRPINTLTTITTVDAETFDITYAKIDKAAGVITRIRDDGIDDQRFWPSRHMIISYSAGYATVPADLKIAASIAVGSFWWSGKRGDPNLKSRTVEGVGAKTWWVGPATDPLLGMEVTELLGPYMNF